MDDLRKGMGRICRASSAYAARRLGGSELTPTELSALREIVFHKNLTQTELCEHLGGIDKAAVARIAQRLEDKGFIARIPSPSDGRAKLLSPLPKASETRLGLISAENDFYKWLFSSLSPRELEALSSVISKTGEKALEEYKNGFKSCTPEGKS